MKQKLQGEDMNKLESFATVEKLEKSWKALTESEKERATVLLEQASNYLRQIAFNNGKDLDAMIAADPSGVFRSNVEMVVLAAVQRMMAMPSEMVPDATSWSQSASPYSESMSFSGEPGGSLFFKNRELQLLGLDSVSGKQTIGILRGVRQ